MKKTQYLYYRRKLRLAKDALTVIILILIVLSKLNLL
jgi:hypothetical protein